MTLLPVLFARSRGLGILVGSLAILALLATNIPIDSFSYTLFSMRSVLLSDVVALFTGVFWVFMGNNSMLQIENSIPPRRLRFLRLGWASLSAFSFAGVGVIVYYIRGDELFFTSALHIRDTFFSLGVAMICCRFLPKQAAGMLILGYAGVCWLVGTIDNVATPASWAFPLYPLDSMFALALSLSLWIAGLTLYVLKEN